MRRRCEDEVRACRLATTPPRRRTTAWTFGRDAEVTRTARGSEPRVGIELRRCAVVHELVAPGLLHLGTVQGVRPRAHTSGCFVASRLGRRMSPMGRLREFGAGNSSHWPGPGSAGSTQAALPTSAVPSIPVVGAGAGRVAQ